MAENDSKPASDTVDSEADNEAAGAESVGQPGYSPSQVEVNRARQQGLGVGQKDLDTQRDPSGGSRSELSLIHI